jgi:hypothetical protein
MPRRSQTYAIRLAVEGGGQVKAELVAVGQSGEQSLKRIVSAGEPLPPNDFVTAYPVDLRDAPVRLIAAMAAEIARAHPAFVSVP